MSMPGLMLYLPKREAESHQLIDKLLNGEMLGERRPFTVEHEYPILIPKKGVLDDHWTENELNDWMWKYGRATIITHPENDRLLNHTADMQIASKRYSVAGIKTVYHPNFNL